MNKFLIIMALLSSAAALTACNTMEGMGQDIQHGGENIEDSANQNK